MMKVKKTNLDSDTSRTNEEAIVFCAIEVEIGELMANGRVQSRWDKVAECDRLDDQGKEGIRLR